MNSFTFSMKKKYIPTEPDHRRRGCLAGNKPHVCLNVINNEFGFSFYQFVTKYRIQKATILLIPTPGYANPGSSQPFPASPLSLIHLPSNSTRASPQNNGNNVTWTPFNTPEYVKIFKFVQSTTEKVKL